MPKAVRFDRYGDADVLTVVDVDYPHIGADDVLVRVRAAGINPGEAKIRSGDLHELWPATFPSGQGGDFAGVVETVGAEITGVQQGDEIIGFTNSRASHAEFVAVPTDQLTAKPAGVPWEIAGGLFVAGTTAFATVRAVGASAGDVVVVSAAAGGVGSLAVQLAKRSGATVIGLASDGRREWLESHGIIQVPYGDGVADRIRRATDGKVDAFIDTYGPPYVDLALELGVSPERIDTVVDAQAVAEHGVKAEGNEAAADTDTLERLAELVAEGELEVPVAATYPLSQVQDAFRELEHGHTFGKIVLTPGNEP
jgi:NADPH:quinone reductase-like Zn-dependent oxidoreductase